MSAAEAVAATRPGAADRLSGGRARWARAGRWLLVGIILAAMLGPGVAVRAGWPEVRGEQVLAVAAAAWLVGGRWRAGLPLRPRLIDWLFLGLAGATLASAVYAPAVLGGAFSGRDLFEVVKIGLYWVLFRFGMAVGDLSPGPSPARGGVPMRTASRLPRRRSPARLSMMRSPAAGAPPLAGEGPGERSAAWALRALLVGGAVAALAGVAQYYDWGGVNGWATPAWAPPHHLRTLLLDGRAVGTVGNPNYFGMLAVIVLLAAVAAGASGGFSASWGDRAVVIAGLLGGAAGLVLSGSRSALVAACVGLAALWVAALGRRWGVRRLTAASGGAAAATALAVALVTVAPRGRDDWLARMAPGGRAGGESSLALRIERWRSVVAPWQGGGDGNGAERTYAPRTPVGSSGREPAGAVAAARDAGRKADLAVIARGLDAYRRDAGGLPADGAALAAALTPAYVERLPGDPSGRAYDYVRTATGFSLAAALDDPADVDWPRYGIGSGASYLRNGSLEEDGARGFRSLPGTRFAVVSDEGLFGERALRFEGNPGEPARRSGVYQQRYIGRDGGEPLTATVWVKLLRPSEGELQLYANVFYADGERRDPLVRVAADPALTGIWQRLVAPIATERGREVTFVGVYLIGEGFRGEALADGFALVDGRTALSFATLAEAAPAAGGLGGRWRESPLLGVGPAKASGRAAVDNEYLVVAERYGVVGLGLYLALWGTVAVGAWRRVAVAPTHGRVAPSPIPSPILADRGGVPRATGASGLTVTQQNGQALTSPDDGSTPPPSWRIGEGTGEGAAPAALALAVLATVAALLVFNLAAGSFLHLQLMGVFWPLAGVALARGRQ